MEAEGPAPVLALICCTRSRFQCLVPSNPCPAEPEAMPARAIPVAHHLSHPGNQHGLANQRGRRARSRHDPWQEPTNLHS